MRGSGGSSEYGQWLLNAIVATVTALIVAVAVVGLSVAVDRVNTAGIEIRNQVPEDYVVHVSGAVATPGVYTVSGNSRLADTLQAAGGLTSDADAAQLNLAARVGDGERIVIPRIADTTAQDHETDPSDSELIDINTATAEELDLLPGVGPVIAGRIVDDRERNGPFLTVESLTRVDGISSGTLEDLRPLVTVGE